MKKSLLRIAMAAFALSSCVLVSAQIKGSGSDTDPYQIATKEDLCNAWSKVTEGKVTYFVQTADIDMAGVSDYVAFCGHSGSYGACVNYDGGNHIISNFGPTDRIAGTGDKAYYCTTLFGVLSGSVKNLGVVDAKIEVDWFEAGILGGFAGVGGNSAITPEVNVENVFVTGKIVSKKAGAVAGGMFGTSGLPLNVKNSYVQVEIENQGYVAGIIAKAATATKIAYSYSSAVVSGNPKALVAATESASITFDNVVAFGSGEACNINTSGSATVVPAGDSRGIATVQGWDAFNAGAMLNGLPALNWQGGETGGIDDITVDINGNETIEYYNLNGVRVENPQSGLYIKKQGDKVEKIMVY